MFFMLVRLRPLYPYTLLTLLALPALWPLLHPGLARANDHLPHFFRVVALDAALRQGQWPLRWSPDLVHGFGYPVFNFFPYLGHLVVEVWHLIGFDFLTAYKIACALALLAAAWFAFQLGRAHWGEAAGLVAGVAYLYNPYLLYDIYIRGSLPETLALALLPLIMVSLRRVAHGNKRARVWAGGLVAAFLFFHNGVALQTMPFLVLYALWETWSEFNWKQKFRPFLLPASAFLLALLLSAFCWLPILAEAGYIQIGRVTLNAGMSYASNFLSWAELLALPRLPVDPALLNPPVVRSLPLAALALAVGWPIWAFHWRARPRPQIFFTLAALTAFGLMLPLARPIWDNVPFLQLTFFPWRLLGPLALFTALLAGSLFSHLNLESWKLDLALSPALVFLIVAGLPFASPPFEPVPNAPTLADLAAFEMPPNFIGTTSVGEYLPNSVKQMPDTGSDREQLMRGETPPRYTAPGAEVSTTPRGAGHTFTITATAPLTFTYRVFYFPGWQATLNGQPIPITVTEPEGLMAVALPAGTHTLAFQFGSTPARTVGNLLSLIGLGLSLWLAFTHPASPSPPSFSLRPPTVFLFVFASLVALARPLLYDAGLTPLLQRHLTAAGLAGVAHPLNHDFAGELTLLGWEATRETIGADDSTTVNLYWKANRPLGVFYGFDVRLVDAAGLTWSEPNPPRPRDWRFIPGTDRWPADAYILDPYVLTPLVGTPSGEYTLQVTVFALHNLQTIGVVPIGAVNVAAPSQRACRESPLHQFSNGLALLSGDFNLAQAAPGDDVTASLCWRVAPTQPAAALSLRLLDSAGNVAAEKPLTLTPADRPGGYTLRDQFRVRLPAALETGDYVWRLSVESETIDVGTLHVAAPPRTFTAPEGLTVLDADLGLVSLYGINIPTQAALGESVAVTLVWEGRAPMSESYRVFLHLMSADGVLVAQSDGIPADWTRPTTGWLPGEYVSETRTLALPPDAPPGSYSLYAGMYLPDSSVRLTNADFPDGRIRVGNLEVINK
jgi:hypothetical protein